MENDEKMVWGAWFVMLIGAILWLLTSCTSTRYVQVPSVTHDTICTNTVHVDTIMHKEKEYVNVYTAGDTVYKVREVTRWREHTSIRHDTLFVHKTDTIGVPVPVERKLTFWERQERNFGKMMLAMLGMGVIILVIRVVRRYLLS